MIARIASGAAQRPNELQFVAIPERERPNGKASRGLTAELSN